MENCIEIKQLSKVIEKNTIVRDISLSLHQGKVYGFIGRNGSGKTMLFRMIAGLADHTAGSIYFNGEEVVFGKKIPFSLGILIENAGMYPEFSGMDNLRFLASIRKKISIDQIRKSIERVGLDPDDTRKIKKYSLGMKQRITIAQAIMEEPQVLLLDEPTNSLDAGGVDTIRQLILEEKDRGAIICLASHNIEDIHQLCDEVWEIKEGKIVRVDKDEEK